MSGATGFRSSLRLSHWNTPENYIWASTSNLAGCSAHLGPTYHTAHSYSNVDMQTLYQCDATTLQSLPSSHFLAGKTAHVCGIAESLALLEDTCACTLPVICFVATVFLSLCNIVGGILESPALLGKTCACMLSVSCAAYCASQSM